MLHDFLEVYGYSKGLMYTIGTFEILGATGLFVGFWKNKVTKLASTGLAIIMVGAVYTFTRSSRLWCCNGSVYSVSVNINYCTI